MYTTRFWINTHKVRWKPNEWQAKQSKCFGSKQAKKKSIIVVTMCLCLNEMNLIRYQWSKYDINHLIRSFSFVDNDSHILNKSTSSSQIGQPLGIDIGPCFLGTGYNTSEISYMVPTLDFSYLVLQKLTVSFKFIDHFIFNYMNDFVFSFPFVQCRRYSTGNSFCCIFSQFFRICRKRTVYFIPVSK